MPGAAAVAAMRAHTVTLGAAVDTAEAIGDTIQLAAVVTDSSGTVLMGIVPAWTTGDPSVALVSQAGTVTAQGPGTAAIVVRVGQVEARSRIVVHQVPASLEMDDTVVTVPESQRAALTAHVADARGNPIVGAEVSWTATDPAIAVIQGSEVVGVSPGRSAVSAAAGPLLRSVAVEVVPVPSSITVLGGEGQHGPAGRVLPVPVSAQIVSRTGRPMAGVPATFTSSATNGVADPAVDTSDSRGMVRSSWRLGETPGRQQLTVSVEGVEVVPALAAEADPVPANTRVVLLSTATTGEAGDTLREPLAVRVTDTLGSALADVAVTWSAQDGGALGALAPRTDSLGEARATWTLGAKAGRQRARIQVGPARVLSPITAIAMATPGQAIAATVKSGDRQLGTVGTALKLPVVLRVLDRHGNPAQGAAIHVEAFAGKVAESRIVSDSLGQAKIRWTLGSNGRTAAARGSPGRRQRRHRGDRAGTAGQGGEARVRGTARRGQAREAAPQAAGGAGDGRVREPAGRSDGGVQAHEWHGDPGAGPDRCRGTHHCALDTGHQIEEARALRGGRRQRRPAHADAQRSPMTLMTTRLRR